MNIQGETVENAYLSETSFPIIKNNHKAAVEVLWKKWGNMPFNSPDLSDFMT